MFPLSAWTYFYQFLFLWSLTLIVGIPKGSLLAQTEKNMSNIQSSLTPSLFLCETILYENSQGGLFGITTYTFLSQEDYTFEIQEQNTEIIRVLFIDPDQTKQITHSLESPYQIMVVGSSRLQKIQIFFKRAPSPSPSASPVTLNNLTCRKYLTTVYTTGTKIASGGNPKNAADYYLEKLETYTDIFSSLIEQGNQNRVRPWYPNWVKDWVHLSDKLLAISKTDGLSLKQNDRLVALSNLHEQQAITCNIQDILSLEYADDTSPLFQEHIHNNWLEQNSYQAYHLISNT
ncbi:MAG: hypothetical protein MPJ24_07105, partial [Pirellulaceae bacterium]|nr:hypothetical protein [Pirellulaceae bacterium]